jgi:hypothetical protein
MAKPKTQDVQDAVNLSPEKENEPLTNPDTGSADAQQPEQELEGALIGATENENAAVGGDGGATPAAQTTELEDAKDGEPVQLIECAVLLDCIYGKHDQIIELTPDEADAAKAGGYVDTHPNAIAAIRRSE